MAEPQPTLAECQAAVDAARIQYVARRTELEKSLSDLVPDFQQTTAILVERAEEFGADTAVETLGSKHPEYDDVPSAVFEALSHERKGEIAARLDLLLDARDVLDSATQALNSARLKTGQSPILYVGDRAYELDYANATARPIDGKGEEFSLDVPHVRQPIPTLSEQERAIGQIEKAQSAPEQLRTRNR